MTQDDILRSITPRRLARMAGLLARRQPDVAVVMENVDDPHNVSAVLRTCDAVGAASAHLVSADQHSPKLSKGVSASAVRWLDVHKHQDIDACYHRLRDAGMTIYATYLGDNAQDLHDLDFTQPSAFVFGNESLGVTDAALRNADAAVKVPMMGMIDSLNISVAAAVVLYEVLRQRRLAGMYEASAWSDEELRKRLRAWLIRENRDPEYANAAEFRARDAPPARNRYTEGRMDS